MWLNSKLAAALVQSARRIRSQQQLFSVGTVGLERSDPRSSRGES